MESSTAYEDFFSDNTRALMEAYVLKLKDERDRKRYMLVYARFAEHVHKDWFECREDDFKSFIEYQSMRYQADEITYSTYAKYYKIIAAFSRHCYKLAHAEIPSPLVPPNYEDYATAARVKAPADTFHSQKIPPLTDVEKVLAYSREADKLVYFGILFSLGTFLKTGEFLKLTARDIVQDSSGSWFAILSDGYPVLLDGDFGIELSEYVRATLDPGDLIFSRHTKKGIQPISDISVRNRLIKACSRVGVKSFTFNELRNSAAVYTADAGATKEEIATSMRYRTTAHIDRLTSLTLPKRNDASKYIHFTLKEDEKSEEKNE